MEEIGLRGLASLAIVLSFVGVLAWLAKRGVFNQFRSRSRSMTVETALPLGERRSLMIVEIEGRRLLLGLTPGSVSFVTELVPGAPFEQELARHEEVTPA